MSSPPRVLWYTNLAAPYRLPVWRALHGDFTLRVELLEASDRLARDSAANRGADWLPRHEPFGIEEVPTIRFSSGEARYYATWDPGLVGRVRSADAVVLGGWESPAYWQVLIAARLIGRPVVGFYESTSDTQRHRRGLVARARRRFFQTVDRVVVPGPAALAAVAAFGVAPEKIDVGFNAVDTASFAPVRSTSPQSLGHAYLYIGQLIERKRVDAILEAFASIAHEADTLHIVGRGHLKEELGALATHLGVEDKVTWTDYVPNQELPAIMSEAHTLVLASDEEVWGLVINEALAAGLQVAVTRTCGVVPSINGMEGVFIADSSRVIARSMEEARAAYQGRISNPEILAYTPERFASVFGDSLRAAMDQVSKASGPWPGAVGRRRL